MMDTNVKINRYVYKQKPDENRSSMQILHEITAQMHLSGFKRGRTTIFEANTCNGDSYESDAAANGPFAKIEYGIHNSAQFTNKKTFWFSRKKPSPKIELKLELRPFAGNTSKLEVITELREITC